MRLNGVRPAQVQTTAPSSVLNLEGTRVSLEERMEAESNLLGETSPGASSSSAVSESTSSKPLFELLPDTGS